MQRLTLTPLTLLLASCSGPLPRATSRDEQPPAAVMPGPHRGSSEPARLHRNAACVDCHEEAAAQWSASLHRAAFTDPDFAAAYAHEPTRFCRGCHAPEAAPEHESPGAAAELGVACVTCHVPQGAALPSDGVLAAMTITTGERSAASEAAPHPIVRDPAFTTTAACAACHDFDHPHAPGVPMQSTVREHQRSPAAGDGCVGCHMRDPPRGPVHHGFAASRDHERLRAALEIHALRPEPARILISLRPRAIGHAFPTGDMFRQVLVEADATDEQGDPLAGDQRILGKIYQDRLAGSSRGRVLLEDTRLLPGAEAVVELDLSGAEALPVHWRVVYQRIDQEGPGRPARPFGEVLLAAGVLPPTEVGPQP
jgi:hypothetical protein